jgi:hypothetical protein
MSIVSRQFRNARACLVRLYLCNFPPLARLLAMRQLLDPFPSPPARPIRPLVSVASTTLGEVMVSRFAQRKFQKELTALLERTPS